MVGRGTRVWKVRKVENGRLVGPVYALKDVWVHEDRHPEHEILQKIREQQPEYSRYFLTPIDFGFALLGSTAPPIPDSTHNILGRQRDLKPTRTVRRILFVPINGSRTSKSQSRKTSSASRHSVGHGGDVPDSKLGGHRDFSYLSKHPRLHYRVVFEEVGDPVHDLRHFSEIFLAIQGGWEDVLPQRGVIMDLEYTKATNDTNEPHDVKMGTAAFMATEVAASQYHRLRALRKIARSGVSAFMPPVESLTSDNKEPIQPRKPRKPRKPLPPFRHNPLHDMESVWWLCLWIVFYMVPASMRSTQAQLDSYHATFRNQDKKFNVLCMPGSLEEVTEHLWDNPNPFAEILEDWADLLNRCYSTSYQRHDASTDSLKSIQVDSEMITESYEEGQRFLMGLRDASRGLPKCETLSEQHQDVAMTRTTNEATHRLVMECVLIDPQNTHKQR
ncbi:hypothetical protein FRC11_015084, partial [Ceratobasidium sp. 423]